MPALGGCLVYPHRGDVAEAERVARLCRGDEDAALQMAGKIMARRLLAPASAKFPSRGDYGVVVTNPAPCRYEVGAHIDSHNVFGALIRT